MISIMALKLTSYSYRKRGEISYLDGTRGRIRMVVIVSASLHITKCGVKASRSGSKIGSMET